MKARDQFINTEVNTLLDSLRYAINTDSSITIEPTPYTVVSMHRHENLASSSRLKFLIDQIIQYQRPSR